MIRLSTILWLTLVALLGFAMFEVKYEVMDIEEQLARVAKAKQQDRDQIHILEAEWAYLTQPGRLAELSRKYLELAPVATQQLGRVDAVPLRPGSDPVAVAAAPPAQSPVVKATTPAKPAPKPSVGGTATAAAAPTTLPAPPATGAGPRTDVANAKPRSVP